MHQPTRLVLWRAIAWSSRSCRSRPAAPPRRPSATPAPDGRPERAAPTAASVAPSESADAGPGDPDPCSPTALKTLVPGKLTIGTDNPAFSPWWAGPAPAEGSTWQYADPNNGQGLEGATAYLIANALGFAEDGRGLGRGPVRQGHPARTEDVRLLPRPGLVQRRPGEGGRPLRRLLRRQPGGRRLQGERDQQGHHGRRPEGLPARHAGRHDEPRLHPGQHPADEAAARLQHARCRGEGARGQADRRPRGGPGHDVLRPRRRADRRGHRRRAADRGRPGALLGRPEQGQQPHRVRQPGDRRDQGGRLAGRRAAAIHHRARARPKLQ